MGLINMKLDEALDTLHKAGYEVEGSFEQKVMEELINQCAPFTRNSDFL